VLCKNSPDQKGKRNDWEKKKNGASWGSEGGRRVGGSMGGPWTEGGVKKELSRNQGGRRGVSQPQTMNPSHLKNGRGKN